ncbi:TetR/AcrR family transcriptional regulator [Metasolibacillus sp. FSL H7-0170]|uniref:TetR/AcrR family transcriptional regulator n=1 Tax=Metasolibacillus sp. FSL H7-0170 TaxID=2921431 RepID=UPI0031590B92
MKRNKIIQTKRMYNIFIDATCDIISNEGIKNVTARKIADLSGYTSSTIYNYFDELSHLIFFAAMKFLEPYNAELEDSLKKAKNAEEKFYITWEIFCKHSFNNPDIFYAIFISNLGTDPNELINRYYEIYDVKINTYSQEAQFIILEHDLAKRNYSLVKELTLYKNIDEEKISTILSTTIFTWQGIMVEIINNRNRVSKSEYIEIYMKFLKFIIKT